ncbi:Ig-like domain-containing protein, partial [Enterobacter roggenkampii]|uniref:Ig-like domain-containing protein n=1 Tax=Enterobacter roggenkampii TaxID=1812935 RepID=UPI002237D7B2
VMARAKVMLMSLLDEVSAGPQVSAYSETAPGVYEAVLTAGDEPGTTTVTTAWRGLVVQSASLAQVRVDNVEDAALADGSLVVVSDGAAANGLATNSVRATVTDANGNPVAKQTVTFSATNGATINATGTTDASGEVVMAVSNTRAGVSTVTAVINNSIQNVDVTFVPGAGIPGVGVVGNDQAPANGTDTITVTFPVQDANGNPAPGTVVDVVITRPDGTTDTRQVVTDANGNASVDIVSTQPGIITVDATAGGGTSSADVEFTPDATGAVIAAGDFVPVDDNAIADGTATNSVQATVTDANGNPVAGVAVAFSA